MGNPKEAPKHFLSGNLSRRSILALGTSALAAACASDAPSNTSINAQVQASVQAGVKATGTAQARLTPTPDTRFPTAITRRQRLKQLNLFPNPPVVVRRPQHLDLHQQSNNSCLLDRKLLLQKAPFRVNIPPGYDMFELDPREPKDPKATYGLVK